MSDPSQLNDLRVTRLEEDMRMLQAEARNMTEAINLLRIDIARWTTRMTTIWGGLCFMITLFGVILKFFP